MDRKSAKIYSRFPCRKNYENFYNCCSKLLIHPNFSNLSAKIFSRFSSGKKIDDFSFYNFCVKRFVIIKNTDTQ